MVISLSTILTSSLLAFSSPLAGSSSQCAGPVHPFGARIHPLSTFQTVEETYRHLEQLVEELRQRLQRGGVDIELRDQIRLELERLRHFPDRTASDASVDALFTEAMLVVAASVQGCDPHFAQAWVDRALTRQELARPSRPRPDLANLPADFVALYDQRAQALSSAKPATIWLHCEIACAVFVDGHHVPVVVGKVEEYTVAPGTHDVWTFHAPDGTPTTSEPTRVSVTEIDLDGGDQSYLAFPNPRHVGLLPSREEWWSMWSFVQRIDWAIESKKSLVNFETSIFEDLIDESPIHARVFAQDLETRELRARVALHLADLSQQAGELDAANAILDRALLWADLLDSPHTLTAAVGKFPGLIELFEERVALLAAKPRGTIEIDCRRCLPVIDGVVVDADTFELPVDRYRVELYPSSMGGELSVFEEAVVRANELTLLQTRSPREPTVVLEPVDFREGYRQNRQLQRWVWGTAGGVAFAGAVVWSFALTTWLIPSLNKIGIDDQTIEESEFKHARREKAIEIGLFVTGAFFLHAELATYLFSRMPPPRRPGIRLMSVGAGLLVSGLATAGHAVTGYFSWQNAYYKKERAVESDKWKYELQETASANVGWVASAATAGLVLSGATLVAVGADRSKIARQNGVVRPARVPPHQRPGVVPIILGGGLLVTGASFVGLGIPALLLEPTKPSAPALVGLVGGATLGVSGAVLVGVGVGVKRKRSTKSRAAMVPWASPNSIGLQLVGQF